MAALVVASLASGSAFAPTAGWFGVWSVPIYHAANHSCCPDGHKQLLSVVFFAVTPASAPCGNQHPCCLKPVPESSPSLPATGARTTPESGRASLIAAEQNLFEKKARMFHALGSDPYDFYSVRSTVLRI